MNKVHEMGTFREKLSNGWLKAKRMAWIAPTVLGLLGVIYYIAINADVYTFASLHPREVRVRKVIYDQAVATGSAATNEYLQTH